MSLWQTKLSNVLKLQKFLYVCLFLLFSRPVYKVLSVCRWHPSLFIKRGIWQKRRSCNKSQPKPLTLMEITAWLVYHRALMCARHSTFSYAAGLGCSLPVSLKSHMTRCKCVCERYKRLDDSVFFFLSSHERGVHDRTCCYTRIGL